MVIFFETEKKLNLIDLNEIEQLIGLDFPNEYKSHLLKYNGGRCKPDI